jgi:hypothetical protein
MTSSASRSREYKSATDGLATMEMREEGKRSRMALKAGRLITASPTQFVARTNIFEKLTLPATLALGNH